MSNPVILWENILAQGTLSASHTTSGFPVSNVLNWALYPANQWRFTLSGGTPFDRWLKCDFGASGPRPVFDTIAVWHNFDSNDVATPEAMFIVEMSDDDVTYPYFVAECMDKVPFIVVPHNPFLLLVPAQAAKRYIRIAFSEAGGSNANAAITLVTIGRRMELPGLKTSLDPFADTVETDYSANVGGQWIGANYRTTNKRFEIRYEDVGIPVDEFFRGPSTSLTWDYDFKEHARANPFWFAWNNDYAPEEVYVCRMLPEYRSPFHTTTRRRSLNCAFEAFVTPDRRRNWLASL